MEDVYAIMNEAYGEVCIQTTIQDYSDCYSLAVFGTFEEAYNNYCAKQPGAFICD